MRADGTSTRRWTRTRCGRRRAACVSGAWRRWRCCCCTPIAIRRTEIRVKEIVQEELPHAFVSASHELSQEYREFERVSTVAANAYIGPRVAAYLGELEEHLEAQGFRRCVLRRAVDRRAVSGGACAAGLRAHAGKRAGGGGDRHAGDGGKLGLGDAIAFDMGGTTAKAGVIPTASR